MKIREGAYYRTRDGDVVGPMRLPISDSRYCWQASLAIAESWDTTGSCRGCEEHDNDLISEVYVSDTPPADAPETKTLRDEFAMAALQAFLGCSDYLELSPDRMAAEAYRQADAMMEARRK